MDAKIGPKGYRLEDSKNSTQQKKSVTRGKVHANGSKMGANILQLGVLGMIIPNICLDVCSMDVLSFLRFSEYINLKLADLYKCKRYPHVFFGGFSTLHSCDMFMMILLVPC